MLTLALSSLSSYGQTGNDLYIKGYVKKAMDSSGIANVNLIRFSDAQGTATNSEGRFQLKLNSKTDSFILSAVGYGRTVFNPPDTFTGRQYETVIFLSEQTYGIEEVVIRGDNQRELNVDLSVPADQAQRIANERRAGGGFGYNIQGAASSLYEAFSNDAEQREKVRRLKRNKRNVQYFMNSPYRAYIRSEFGLRDEEIRHFLEYCNFRKPYHNANYYEVTKKLDRCYTLYYNKVLRERQIND